MAVLQVDRLHVQYTGMSRPVLRDVSITLEAGEAVALLGPSGSGKTSLLSHVAGFQVAPVGTIRIVDTDTRTLDGAGWDNLRARTLGFVFQTARLVPFLTAEANIRLALQAMNADATPHARLADLVSRLGLSSVTGRRADLLSVGEAQRVAVARALVKDPALVFADEPTGALDAVNAAAVMDTLLKDRGGRAVLVATHDSRVADRCDRRITLLDGELA
jgi:putative ABC transport system ATP-binding protein